jgi:hypothetical protein
MQQIADWLKKLGMSEYAQRFAENDIDADVLPKSTDQDLKDLGVSLGHRRRMLRAIRDLGNASVAVTAPAALVSIEPTRQVARGLAARTNYTAPNGRLRRSWSGHRGEIGAMRGRDTRRYH